MTKGLKTKWSLAVFCGSKVGNLPVFESEARSLGRMIAEKNVRLVYGGGHVGLMGVVADAVMEAGGQAFGVIPQALVDKELAHNKLTELVVTQTMHHRKAIMADQSDAFVALPGGFGTLDELFEILTWAQLGIHHKPVALLDGTGFFDGLVDWLGKVTSFGFLKTKDRENLKVFRDPESLLAFLAGGVEQIRASVQGRTLDIR
ncbi:MAG: TIGR00730 family Rossman fold protein [Gemmataceae bacterium]|nr:TIGR00730 family Rossman fold protein [Gemmataceae bacterium]